MRDRPTMTLLSPRVTVETIPYDRPIPETRPLVGGRLL